MSDFSNIYSCNFKKLKYYTKDTNPHCKKIKYHEYKNHKMACYPQSCEKDM